MGFEKIFENTYVCDEGGVRFFLLTGEEKALLVDSGMETKNVRALAGEVTDLPLTLFNTHTDRDHTGGNGEFGQVMLNPAELVNYASPRPSQEILPVFDGDILDLGERPLRAIDLPVHTPGSTALLDLKSGALFSGDPIQKDGRIFMFLRLYPEPEKTPVLQGSDPADLSLPRDISPDHGHSPATHCRRGKDRKGGA